MNTSEIHSASLSKLSQTSVFISSTHFSYDILLTIIPLPVKIIIIFKETRGQCSLRCSNRGNESAHAHTKTHKTHTHMYMWCVFVYVYIYIYIYIYIYEQINSAHILPPL